MVCQLVAVAITLIAVDQMIPIILASPALRDEHCRQIMELLIRHEVASIDGYREGLRYEYVVFRQILANAVKDPRGIDRVLGGSDSKPGQRDQDSDIIGRLLEQELNTNPSAIADGNARVDEYFRDLLSLDRPVSEWPDKKFDPMRIWNGRLYTRIAIMLIPVARASAQAEARAILAPRAAECLVALKLWRNHRKEAPTDLEAVVKAAGILRVPIDPYSGKPLRMAIIDGEPVIYSVGRDGRDDGGRIDSNNDHRSGDQTFRLPATARRTP
jgi:hypothetical protein